MPAPSVVFSGALFVKMLLHEKNIKAAYAEVDLREIFYQELIKNGGNLSPKIVASIKNSEEKSIVITETPGVFQKDPKACEFVFEDIAQKIGKDYMLIVKVIDYGFKEGGFSLNSRISYIASIVDMKNNIKIWQMKSSVESSYPMLSTFSVAKNPENVRGNLRDCVVGIVKQISQNINKTVK